MGEERLPCSFLLGALKSTTVVYPMRGTQETGASSQKGNLQLSTEGFLNKQI